MNSPQSCPPGLENNLCCHSDLEADTRPCIEEGRISGAMALANTKISCCIRLEDSGYAL